MHMENGSASSNLLQGFELYRHTTVSPQMLPLMHSKYTSILNEKQNIEALPVSSQINF